LSNLTNPFIEPFSGAYSLTQRNAVILGHLLLLGPSVGFGISHAIQGHLMVSILLAIASLANLWSLYHWACSTPKALPSLLTCLFPTLAILYNLSVGPLYGGYWIAVNILILYFLLPVKLALYTNLIYMIPVAAISYHHYPIEGFIRLVVSGGLCSFFTYFTTYSLYLKQRELHQLAHIDTLTSLPNRRQLDKEMERWIELAARKKGEELGQHCLALIDLDHFKSFNDRFGHVEGDDILRRFSQMARSKLRASDLLARFGGEEFALLMPYTSITEAEALLKRLHSSATPLCHNEMVTFSSGIAAMITGDSISQWIDRSDQALYQAKRDGRNCDRVYHSIA
jgi:diguanylate cyclase (GGDEF)-like protein